MLLQCVFSFTGKTVMPIAPHADDLVVCEDTGNELPRGETTECADGNHWEDSDSLSCCVECDGLFDVNHLDENDGYCESCHRDNHTSCDGCADSVHNDDIVNSQCGGDWCETCYNDTFAVCDGCHDELDLRGDNFHSDSYGTISCNDCRAPESWDQNPTWRGCAEYDKIGSSRKFGVELETCEAGDYQDWAHNKSWGAKTDGSLHADNAMEFVSPVLYGNDGYYSVVNFCRDMEDNGCEVDEECGFHLHIDLRDTLPNERKAIALAYHYTRGVWASFIDESRRDTYYARYNVDSEHGSGNVWGRDDIMVSSQHPRSDERYVWVNWRAFDGHGSVEVRSHEATCDGRAVINWIKAHTKFVDYVKELTVGQVTRIFGNEDSQSIMRELRHIWKDADLYDYYTRKSNPVLEGVA